MLFVHAFSCCCQHMASAFSHAQIYIFINLNQKHFYFFSFFKETLLTARINVDSLSNLTDCGCLRERQSVAPFSPQITINGHLCKNFNRVTSNLTHRTKKHWIYTKIFKRNCLYPSDTSCVFYTCTVITCRLNPFHSSFLGLYFIFFTHMTRRWDSNYSLNSSLKLHWCCFLKAPAPPQDAR